MFRFFFDLLYVNCETNHTVIDHLTEEQIVLETLGMILKGNEEKENRIQKCISYDAVLIYIDDLNQYLEAKDKS